MNNFVLITIDDLVAKYPEKDRDGIRARKEHWLAIKNAGTKCEICGNEMWANGSSACDWAGCFPCITGETDASNDYEIY